MSVQKTGTFVLNIENQKEQLDFKVDAWLRKKGWEYTSSGPGSLWLWRKKIKAETYVVNKANAIYVQSYLDEYGEEA